MMIQGVDMNLTDLLGEWITPSSMWMVGVPVICVAVVAVSIWGILSLLKVAERRSGDGKRAALVIRLFVDFRGRISREMWWSAILVFFAFWIFVFLPIGLVAFARFTLGTQKIIIMLFYLFLGWSFLVVNIKRLHDRNLPGWWLFIALIALVGVIYVKSALDFAVVLNRIIALITVLGVICCIVQVGFLPGDEGINRYGTPAAFLKTWRKLKDVR